MRYRLLCVLAVIVALGGCATAPPPWHGGFLDSLSDYYDQGTGGGNTLEKADRNAQFALVGFQQGIELDAVTEDMIRELPNQMIEITTRQGVQRINGKLPAGSYIAERWQDREGYWWSYAVYEKSGRERLIQQLRNTRLKTARFRAVVPGWAQLTKEQKSKGWKIIGVESGSLLGWATLALLQRDFLDRRDDPRLTRNTVDYDYYDKWANRFFWGGVFTGSVAGMTYLYSLIDGLVNVPPTYLLLLNQLGLELDNQPNRVPMLVFHYPLGK